MNWTDKDKQRLREAVAAWEGTPHVHRRAIRGKGVDCVNFVAAVLADAGIVDRERLPSYPTAWGFMSPKNVLGVGLAKVLHCKRIPWEGAGGLSFGDIVIFKAGRQSNHAGIIVDGRLWHVMTGGTVHAALPARFMTGIQEIVRLIDRGWKKKPTEVNIQHLEA